jgi:hypothetical protein
MLGRVRDELLIFLDPELPAGGGFSFWIKYTFHPQISGIGEKSP